MRKKKNPINILNQIDFSALDQQIDFPTISKFIRATLNVTQQQMAEKLDITLRGYSFWEEGRRIPKGWQAIKLYTIYLYAKEYSAKTHSSQNETSNNPSSQEENLQNQVP